MRFTFTGKNMTISDSLKERVQHKLGKLEKMLPPETDAHVTMSVTKFEQKIEVTIPLHKRILRAEVSAPDAYAAIDSIVDILEKQMVKYKSRLRDRSRRDQSFNEELAAVFKDEPFEDDKGFVIAKTKRFALKPMDAEEAVMEMELLDHNFYVFRNGKTDEVNVVYHRKDGTYGLIEPEF